MIAVRVRHDMFSNTATVQEASKTPPRPRKSGIHHDIAVSPIDHNSVEQPTGKQRAGMNSVGDRAELGRHSSSEAPTIP